MRSPDEIRALKASADLVGLFQADGHKVTKEGGRWVACCPFHQERTPSCVLYDDGGYKCFGCGARGDAIEYLRKWRKLTFDQACEALGSAPKRQAPAKIDRRKSLVVIMPVPANAPRCGFQAYSGPGRRVSEALAMWPYRSLTGELLMIVTRHNRLNDDGSPRLKDDGSIKKEIFTWVWARRDDGSCGWACRRPSRNLPLYGLDRLADKPDAEVLVVEGEKSADAGHQFLPFMATVTWPGGASNLEWEDSVDWSPLKGRSVVLWPDYDQEGAAAMANVAKYLQALGVARLRVIDLRRLTNRPRGWDIADGTREDAELVMEFAV
jgi:hypothetical protein